MELGAGELANNVKYYSEEFSTVDIFRNLANKMNMNASHDFPFVKLFFMYENLFVSRNPYVHSSISQQVLYFCQQVWH